MSQIPCNGSCCSSCKKSCVALQYALWGCGRGEGWLARCLGAVGRGVVAKRRLAVGPPAQPAHLASTKDQQHPACTNHHHQRWPVTSSSGDNSPPAHIINDKNYQANDFHSSQPLIYTIQFSSHQHNDCQLKCRNYWRQPFVFVS